MRDDRLTSLNAAVDELEERLRANSYSNVALVSELNKCIGYIMRLLSAKPSATDTNVATTDVISRAAVVDAIDGVDWYHINKHGEMVHGANDAEHQAWYKANDIYAAIERVPSAQWWIPCSERLPEPGVYVLVDGADIPGGDRFPLIDKICDDGEWLNCDGSEWSAVAWMPIPEPWKGEQE